MTAFWEGLSDRERVFVGVGSVILALLILTQVIMAPLSNWRDARTSRLAAAESDYKLVVQASAYSGAAATAAADMETPARNAVTTAAQRRSIILDFVNARPDGSVEANVGAAPSAALFAWIADLERGYGIRLSTADIARDTEDGTLSQARLVFTR